MNLSKLFEPESIAVIGASRSPKKIGHAVLANIKASGFKGQLIPVNPHARRILGLPCYARVGDVPGAVDVAVIVLPAKLAASSLTECGKKKIPFAVIISAGFSEISSDGAAMEAQLHRVARKYTIQLLGPNCMGYVNTHVKLNASFSSGHPKPGGVSFITQSGALLVSLIDWSREVGVGMSKLVSLGNESGISEVDVLEYLSRDPQTSIIALYLERLSDGPRFISLVSKISRKKPIIVLKAGDSPAGQQAVLSHTGSLAGSSQIFSAVMRGVGAIEVQDLEELFNLIKFFAFARRNPSRSVVIVTNAGGPAIVAVDLLSHTSLQLAVVPSAVQKKLSNVLPNAASVKNPIDLVGDADVNRFRHALDIVLREKSFGNVLLIVTPQTTTPRATLARYLQKLHDTTDKNLLVCLVGGEIVAPVRRLLTRYKILNFNYPYDALHTLDLAKKFYERHAPFRAPLGLRSSVRRTAPMLMSYVKVQRLLRTKKFPIQTGIILQSPNDIRYIKQYPVALKVLSPQIVHKMKSGAVQLQVQSPREVVRFWNNMRRKFSRNFEGVLVQPMVFGGTEIIVGMKQDLTMGVVVMVGIGGSFADEIHDTSLSIGYPNTDDARRMIRELKHQELLQSADRNFLERLIVKVGKLAKRSPRFYEMDFNPVRVYTKGGIILDARIVTSQ